MTRQSWDTYFLDIAKVVAKRSTCLRVPNGVGALIVKDNRILSTGYAGSIRGMDHCTEEGVGCLIDEKTKGCVRTVHAEINAILQAAQHGVSISGATVYTTLSPCLSCFKAIANGDIRRIVFSTEYRIVEPQMSMATECGVIWEHVSS